MSENPAIHRHPSGDVDIALPHDDPDATAVNGDDSSDEPLPDSGRGRPA
ncbi:MULTISPECIES: hypothetical protein [unclassified Frankia]|nr:MULTISPECIES: hypothetical protein [unclassified Frankia]